MGYALTGRYFHRPCNRSVIILSLLIGVVLAVGVLARPHLASAATGACTAPSTDYGTVTGLSVTTTGATTNIWSRMAIPDTTSDSYLLEIDNSSGTALDCFMVTAGSGAVYASGATTYFNNDSSNWVDTTLPGSGAGSLPAGTYHLKLIGNAPNVLVDRLIFAQDSSCTPTGTGDNCTDVDVTPPAISSVGAGSVTQTTATVTWTTNEAADSQVEYGTSVSYGSSTTLDSSQVTNHTVSLSGLTPGTTYHYRVDSRDAAGNLGTSSDATFTTEAPAGDTTKPSITMQSPANGSTISGTQTVSATATDNVGVVGVQFKLDNNNLGSEDTTASGTTYSVSWNTTTATNGTHTLTAVARDAAGNIKTATSVTVTVNNVSYLAQDINQDGKVDYLDLSALSHVYNKTGSAIVPARADINGDGKVDYLDLSSLSNKYSL